MDPDLLSTHGTGDLRAQMLASMCQPRSAAKSTVELAVGQMVHPEIHFVVRQSSMLKHEARSLESKDLESSEVDLNGCLG